ncbi:hypothetical protein [Ekhidna sp.]|uniref:hypothetical protein n=1 Tax=Ekhidna sp. TaxID=2608089 RepID=UPI003297856C
MKKAVVYIYNSFKDPLFQSNMLLYLLDANKELDYSFALITYEQSEFAISKAEKKELKKELKERNIYWIPLRWHSGKLKLIKKTWDALYGLLIILKYRLLGYNRIVSLGTVSGSFAYIYSVLFRMRHYLYQYEPHSEFLKDMGIWSERSLSFQVLNWLEKRSGLYTEVIATGTIHMMNRLHKMGSKAQVFKIPSCVNDQLFSFSKENRSQIRESLQIVDRKVLIYVGKFGGIYFDQEVFKLCKSILERDPTFFFLFLTPNDQDTIKSNFKQVGISEKNYYVSLVPYNEVYRYISASDIGLVSVPPLPSQKFRSPIKVGEYLCCGIPYIVCKGVSEDDEYAKKEGVGVVLDNFEEVNIEKQFVEIEDLMKTDSRILRQKCRSAGLQYRGFSKLRFVSLNAFKSL